MRVQPGDRVRFLNEVGGGIVTRLEGNLVFVEDEDGFEVPCPVYEVVLIEKKQGSEPDNSPSAVSSIVESVNEEVSKRSPIEEEMEEEGHDEFSPRLYLAFLNAGKTLDENGTLQLHFINDSNYYCTYLFSQLGTDGYMHALYQGLIEPNTKIQLGERGIREMDVNWEVQMILFKKGKPFPALVPVSTSLKIKAKRFLKANSLVANDFFFQPASLISLVKNELEQKLDLLTDSETQAVLKEKEAKPVQKSAVKRKSTPELLEIDLHIHELLDSWESLSNSEILQIQMDKFSRGNYFFYLWFSDRCITSRIFKWFYCKC